MRSTDYFLTTKPSEIQAVFVSDLHLSAQTPRLCHAFIGLIDDLCTLPNLGSLYILGDWLDAWIGDDVYLSLPDTAKAAHWLTPVLNSLKKLADNKVQIFVMHGNRDFTLSNQLVKQFAGAIITEPYYLTTSQIRIRLEHGDALCTDDTKYQHYRAIIRQPIVLWLLLHLPLSIRSKLGQNIKNQSSRDKTHKSYAIMDANIDAIKQAMSTCQLLIHGHTHRPAVHQVDDKTRLVLGDWRDDGRQVIAEIGLLIAQNVILTSYQTTD